MNIPFPLVSSFPVVGLSGSRAPSPGLASVASAFVSGLVASSWSGVLAVGCAPGIDAIGRGAASPGGALPVSRLSVFAVAAGASPWEFAQRSARLVSALADGPGGGLPRRGCLVSFPLGACPAGLAPCAVWRSASGSGSWGSLALALGLGVPVLLFAPGFSVSAPAAIGGRFSAVSGSPGWWWAAASAAVQASLF